MPKETTDSDPFPNTATMTLLGLLQKGLVKDDTEPAAQNTEYQEYRVDQRTALSTILTSVLDILDDDDDMFLEETGDSLGPTASAFTPKNNTMTQ